MFSQSLALDMEILAFMKIHFGRMFVNCENLGEEKAKWEDLVILILRTLH